MAKLKWLKSVSEFSFGASRLVWCMGMDLKLKSEDLVLKPVFIASQVYDT